LAASFGCLSLLSGKDPQWFQTLVTWIGNAFLFTAGIAVGKSASNKRD
jgi:arginine exporter protein ArgO